MANRIILLCLLLAYLCANITECGRFGGGRSSGGRSSGGRSSGGRSGGYGHSSSSGSHSWGSSHSKPASTSWGSSRSSGSHSYPSSSSGLSGSGKSSGSSWSSGGSHGYPSSSSGLSGSGSSSWSSGSRASYPSSSSGLSGSGSGKSSHPSSSSGSSFYPSSSSGLSGTGNQKPSYPTGSSSNSYRPPYHPSSSYNNHHGSTYHGSNVAYQVPPIYHSPTYYSSPQHIYVHEYRNSGSRYGDLLTGLTLYNLGRSHSNYHDHYYYDDYYRRRYDSPSSSYRPENRPANSAVCTLRIQENGKLEMLKIPCEIVSTFTEGSRKETHESVVNTTVCVTNSSTVNNTLATKESSSDSPVSATLSPNTILQTSLQHDNASKVNVTSKMISNNNAVSSDPTLETITTSSVGVIGISSTDATITLSNILLPTSTTKGPSNLTPNVSSNVTVTNSTTCTTNITVTDPLKVKGPSMNPSNMKCSVEIQTKEARLRNEVDCKVLMEYAKMPEPKKDNDAMLPSRSKLKSWLQKPPWWLSMFIAV